MAKAALNLGVPLAGMSSLRVCHDGGRVRGGLFVRRRELQPGQGSGVAWSVGCERHWEITGEIE